MLKEVKFDIGDTIYWLQAEDKYVNDSHVKSGKITNISIKEKEIIYLCGDRNTTETMANGNSYISLSREEVYAEAYRRQIAERKKEIYRKAKELKDLKHIYNQHRQAFLTEELAGLNDDNR